VQITDMELEPAARALYEHASPEVGPYGPRKDWGDNNWNPEVRQSWFDGARAVLEAAPQPVVDREAVKRVINEARALPATHSSEPSVEAVMELARPMPTREQIAEALMKVRVSTGEFAVGGKAVFHGVHNELADAVLALINGSAK